MTLKNILGGNTYLISIDNSCLININSQDVEYVEYMNVHTHIFLYMNSINISYPDQCYSVSAKLEDR